MKIIYVHYKPAMLHRLNIQVNGALLQLNLEDSVTFPMSGTGPCATASHSESTSTYIYVAGSVENFKCHKADYANLLSPVIASSTPNTGLSWGRRLVPILPSD